VTVIITIIIMMMMIIIIIIITRRHSWSLNLRRIAVNPISPNHSFFSYVSDISVKNALIDPVTLTFDL